MPITAAIGRNTRPVSIGERLSTCCRYSEPMYHIGRIAALNRKMIPLTSAQRLGERRQRHQRAVGALLDQREGIEDEEADDHGTSAVEEPQP